jgi:tRNA dimethylallyltransferase
VGLIVVCGATATGKTGLAIALAERLRASRLNSAIISADSRQVYREFNIGTAKPSSAEQKRMPHYLIDICDPTETLTVADYQERAQELIEREGRRPKAEGKFQHERSVEREQKGGESEKEAEGGSVELGGIALTNPSLRSPHSSTPVAAPTSYDLLPTPYIPLLVGGTGLYIRSVTRGLIIPQIPPQLELRSQLQQLGQRTCYAMLQQVDPQAAQKIHANDEVRTLRSLEVYYTTGRSMSAQQGEQPPSYPILHIGLDCPDTGKLRQRIARRAQQMVADGFVDEVESLCQKYGAELPLLNTLGYAELKQYVAGKTSLDIALEQTIVHTRQFAKRQRTWFRAVPEIEWFDADEPDLVDQVGRRVDQFIQSCLSAGKS